MNRLKSITDMLTIPMGNRNVGASGYSCVTDSQFFFGSQFWPENSQGASQDVSLSSRTSQQSSQEGSDPSFSTNYHTKPLLFGEAKDKSKPFNLLQKFEEDKKNAKGKNDSEMLAKECQHFRETLNNIQQLVEGTEKNTAVCHSVLENFNNLASTFQEYLQTDISQQFETLLKKLNSQQEAMTELQDRVQKTGDSATELGSSVTGIKTSVESLREGQERDRNVLEEALKLLSTLVSKDSSKPTSTTVMDSVIQTSPMLEESFSSVLQENRLEGTQLEGTQLNDICASYTAECSQVRGPPQDARCFMGKRKSLLRCIGRRKKRPLVISQKSKYMVSEENRQSVANYDKKTKNSSVLCEVTSQENIRPDSLMPLNTEHSLSEAAGCIITPLCSWSQDSNSPSCLEVDAVLEKLSSESKTENPGDLWQLFDKDW